MGAQSDGLHATGQTLEPVGQPLALPGLDRRKCALRCVAYVPKVAHALYLCASFFGSCENCLSVWWVFSDREIGGQLVIIHVREGVMCHVYCVGAKHAMFGASFLPTKTHAT